MENLPTSREILIKESESQIKSIKWDIEYHETKINEAIIKLNLAEFALNELKK